MNYNLIAALDQNNGIGYQNNMPWHVKEDTKYFRKMTANKTVIMGRYTWESVGYLPNRRNIVITTNPHKVNHSEVIIFDNLNDVLENYHSDDTFIIGGESIYTQTIHRARRLYITRLNATYTCDAYFPKIPDHFKVVEIINLTDDATVYVYENMFDYTSAEHKYLRLLYEILKEGEYKSPRNNPVLSLFGKRIKFRVDMDDDWYIMPILTTKKMFIKGVITELIWFLRGDTSVKYLNDRGVHIWDRNAVNGDIGPGYGYQWVNWGGKGLNQVQRIIDKMRNSKEDRDAVMSAWNFEDLDKMALPPCHILYVFNYAKGKLNVNMTMRSTDVFLGLPFNIASTAFLLLFIAKLSGLCPGEIIINCTDAHIYEQHIRSVETQIMRTPYYFPKCKLKREIKSLEDVRGLEFDDFEFIYFSHPKLSGELIV
jgi:thymidylate synthase/dihydrofolate reductase